MSNAVVDKKDIAQSFGKAAQQYDSAAHFQRWVGDRLLQKVPETARGRVMDLGAGTGYFLPTLAPFSEDNCPVAVDLAIGMAAYAKAQHGERACYAVADAERLPFKGGSFDLIFSSLSIQWCYDLDALFAELVRVLRPGGVFVFSTLLEGTLSELEASWKATDQRQHVNEFFTLEDYRRAGETDAAVFTELCQVEKVLWYDKVITLMRELKTLGAHNMTEKRSKHVTGKAKLSAVIQHYEGFRTSAHQLPATYQVGLGVLQKKR